VEIGISRDDLYHVCGRAWEHADTGYSPPGTNHWLAMFADYLKETLDKKIQLDTTCTRHETSDNAIGDKEILEVHDEVMKRHHKLLKRLKD